MLNLPERLRAQVLGETLEYVCAGEGAPAVVLVGGAGGPVEGWYKVFGPISKFTRVLAYSRAGVGGSSTPAVPQVGSHSVQSLRELLGVAGVAPPYVLVGHSFGGLIVNLFARLHPAEVAAVVMLDATAPGDPSTMAMYETKLQRLVQRVLGWLAPMHPNAEVKHVEQTVAELERAPPFPSVPLIVVTGGRPAMAWAMARAALDARAANQKELAALSPLGRQLIAARSGHFPQFSEPEIVIAAVAEASRLSSHRPATNVTVAAASPPLEGTPPRSLRPPSRHPG